MNPAYNLNCAFRDFLSNAFANNDFLKELEVFLGQTEEFVERPGVTINTTEAKEIAPGCGIFEGNLELLVTSQSYDDGAENHAKRVEKVLGICLNPNDVEFPINAKQKYIHLSGIYSDTQINTIVGNCWVETLRFKVVYMVYEL